VNQLSNDDYRARYERERSTIADLAAAVGEPEPKVPNRVQQESPDVEPGEDVESPPASDAQLRFLERLLGKDLIEAEKAEAIRAQISGMTKARASRYIDRLVEILDEREPKTANAGTERPASKKQADFLRTLLDEREHPSPDRLRAKLDAGEIGSKQASSIIEDLLASRRLSVYRDDVPAGRYALTGEDGTTDFYKVDRPTEGKWAGRVFARLLVASGGHGVESLREERVGRGQTAGVLDRIAEAGVQSAMERFGRELGSCGHCGRALTNAESIERGIGPVCAGKMGWS
jgi:hypothetical protein